MNSDQIVKELKEKIEELIDKAKDASDEVREEMEETITALKLQRDKLEVKMADFKTKNEPKIEEAKHHLKTAAEEIGKAFEKLFRKGPGTEEPE
ncbi:MAG: regulator of replication initiation timing [Roseivirga sp.]|jgi:regulator of replication initiation timing